jgi:hypothetical protein
MTTEQSIKDEMYAEETLVYLMLIGVIVIFDVIALAFYLGGLILGK